MSNFDINNFINPTVQNMKPSGIRKFFDIVNTMEDAISLGVGEPDFITPWHIRDAGIYSLEKGQTYYTSNSGLLELREEICNYVKKFDLSYNPDEVLVTVGGSEAIDLVMRTVLSPGDEVIIPEPSFVCYKPCTALAGGVPVTIQTKAENGFRLTKDELLEKITDKTKILVLSYPNNPTGAVMELEDLKEIAEVVKEFTFFHNSYTVNGLNWTVEGNFLDHDYTVESQGVNIAAVQKEWFTWGDAYRIDVSNVIDPVLALSVVLVIDACIEAERD